MNIKDNCRCVKVQCRLDPNQKLDLPEGMEEIVASKEQIAAREIARTIGGPGEQVFRLADCGNMIGSSLFERIEQNGFYLGGVSVEKRGGTDECRKTINGMSLDFPSTPPTEKIVEFRFYREVTKKLGYDVEDFFDDLMWMGWTNIVVYENPFIKDSMKTNEVVLVIRFQKKAQMPKLPPLEGEHFGFGIHKVVNQKKVASQQLAAGC